MPARADPRDRTQTTHKHGAGSKLQNYVDGFFHVIHFVTTVKMQEAEKNREKTWPRKNKEEDLDAQPTVSISELGPFNHEW